MKIKLYRPPDDCYGFKGQGRKDNQEDNQYNSPDNRFFILCDGMGGHEKGEVASETVCLALNEYFTQNPPLNGEISQEYFDKAVLYAYQKLDTKDTSPNSDKKMGTTLTCVYFGDNGVLVAHIGDSRVYQIRPSDYTQDDYRKAIKIETKDHSLVRQLIDIGEITEEEAKTHPKRNVITKCMQPHDKRDMPDYDSSDVMAGDYFFLCSDGILENITSEILCKVLAEDIPYSEKISRLRSYCDGKTRDNYTCFLLQVEDGYLPKLQSLSRSIPNLVGKNENPPEQPPFNPPPEQEPPISEFTFLDWLRQNLKNVLFAVTALVCLFFLYSKIESCGDDIPDDKNKPKQEKPKDDPKKNNKRDNKKDDKKNQKEVDLIHNLEQNKEYTRTPLEFGIVQYANPKTGELVLVNENTPSMCNLVTVNGIINIKFSDSDSVFNGRKVEYGDLKVYQFTCDTTACKDTVAQIVWTLEKESPQSPPKTVQRKITSKWKIFQD